MYSFIFLSDIVKLDIFFLKRIYLSFWGNTEITRRKYVTYKLELSIKIIRICRNDTIYILSCLKSYA